MAQNKTLFIDGQVFQSAAWDRGMGKYSIDLLKALTAANVYPYDETYLILGSAMAVPDGLESIVKQTMPTVKLLQLDLKVPVDPSKDDMVALQKQNEMILTNYIDSKNIETADYVILSLFIDQVCSVFPRNTRNILLFYDLIPFQYFERYGKLSNFQNYLSRYKTLLEADIIWAISQTVADDLSINLGIPPERIKNIDGAPIVRDSDKSTKPSVSIPERYLLMPSGNDLRKNNVRAVQAFELYRRTMQDNELHLILTSYFDDRTKQLLLNHSEHILFTGNVAESELHWLYQHAEALLFVPEYEGLGLPILEAAESNKPIVCSDIAVFNEMSTTAFYFADPYDPESISAAIGRAQRGEDFASKKAKYPALLSHYTWEHTAAKAIKAFEQVVPKPELRAKPKLAIFAPSPASYSAIGKMVILMHPALQNYFDVDYYLEEGHAKEGFERPNYLPYVANVFSAAQFTSKKYAQYDQVLYHIGNSEFHLDTVKNALYLPGYAIFHDTHLTNIFENDLQYYGYITKDRADAEARLNRNDSSSYITSLASRQISSIVHSDYAATAVRDAVAGVERSATVDHINLPVVTPLNMPRKADGNNRPLVLGFAGIIHAAKGLDTIEKVVNSAALKDCHVHVFGLSLVHDDVIRRLQMHPNVSVDTNVTDFQFQTMLSKVDILVNFRGEYRGESSAATLEAMRFGAIPIVRNIGWYAELPDDTVIKAENEGDLLLKLEQLVLDETKRLSLRENARKLTATQHTYAGYVAKLAEVLARTPTKSGNTDLAEAIRRGDSKDKITRYLSQ